MESLARSTPSRRGLRSTTQNSALSIGNLRTATLGQKSLTTLTDCKGRLRKTLLNDGKSSIWPWSPRQRRVRTYSDARFDVGNSTDIPDNFVLMLSRNSAACRCPTAEWRKGEDEVRAHFRKRTLACQWATGVGRESC